MINIFFITRILNKFIRLDFRIDFSLWRKILNNSWPLFLSAIFISIYTRLDHILLFKLKGPEQLGLYSAAVKLAEYFHFIPLAAAASVFPLMSKYFYISQEIFKNIFQLRLPVLGARNEWLAIQRLHTLAIPTLEIVGYGSRGLNPARLKSFLITRELPEHISLEDFCKHWPTQPPPFLLKQNLIKEVARIARTLHTEGINHRDFYICHFLLKIPHDKNYPTLYLIDLHRASVRTRTPIRWIIKDLAGLYFSSKEIGLTKRDLFRFIREYGHTELSFWLKVKKRGDKLYRKHAK